MTDIIPDERSSASVIYYGKDGKLISEEQHQIDLIRKKKRAIYREKKKEKRDVWERNYSIKNKEKIKETGTKWRNNNKIRVSLTRKEWRKSLRLAVLSHYSQGTPQCACCGEGHIEFLTIDHINGGGKQHYKQINGSIYHWLARNNYPEGFQVLCWNCNSCKGHYVECYHKNNEIQSKQPIAKYNYTEKYRNIVLSHYSQGIPKCSCCGETTKFFLTIDHINNDGAEHRREIGIGGGILTKWLIKNNFPEGFRVLCYNCNNSLGHYGFCVHNKIKTKTNIFPNWLLYLPFKKDDALVNIGVNLIKDNIMKTPITPAFFKSLIKPIEVIEYAEMFA